MENLKLTTNATLTKNRNSKLQILSSILGQNIQLVLDELGIDYKKNSSKFYGACPIHHGDNNVAWNLYPNEEEGTPIWKCRTHHCHEKYKKTILGLIHGVLESRASKQISFEEAVKWASNIVDIDLSTLKVDYKKIEKQQFVTNMNFFTQKEEKNTYITRDDLRARLKIPAQYYIDRGFSSEILNKYDVGLCDNPDKPMYNRIVVPIYDDKAEFVVGTTARSIWERCLSCNCFHNPIKQCIKNPYFYDKSKWINNEGFQAELHLYNYWFAKKYIQETGVAIIVEGQGDVWRAVEAGINNVVGMFKNGLSDGQLMKLEKSGALSLIVLTDNDEGGKIAMDQIKRKCSRLYRLYFPKYIGKDIGDLNTDYITSDIKPFIDEIISI